jgi:hypothetical protein
MSLKDARRKVIGCFNIIGFCRRGILTTPNYYDVDNQSIEINGNLVRMKLLHEDSKNDLKLSIYVLKNGIFRMKLKGSDKRFRVSDTDDY